MSVFKTYDIRGIYPKEINEKLFYSIGLRLVKLKINKIVIGRDARLSSDSLFDSFSKGLIDSGINVIDLGVVTSPMLSFYCVTNKIMGTMITASHNPREYNGIKFVDEKGIQLDYESFLIKIQKALKIKGKKSKINGKIVTKDVSEQYKRHILSKFNGFGREIKVVFDCSNGVGGLPLIKVLPNLNIESCVINEKLDGNFPAHDCDQTKPQNLKQLQNEVLRNKTDLGIMFDGDADRCAFVDEKAQIVPLDLAFLVLALNELKRNKIKNPKILFDLRFSKVVSEILKEKGAIPKIMRVGNPFYKKEMHKDNSVLLAGELSGHIMFKDDLNIDDPLFASIKMIELLSNSHKNLSEIISEYKKYYSSGEISIKVRSPKKIIKAIGLKYKKEHELHVDGISVEREDVWFNARPSNTEPLIRFDIEGLNEKVVENQKKELIRIIRNTR